MFWVPVYAVERVCRAWESEGAETEGFQTLRV